MSVGRYGEKMKIVLIGGFFGSGKTTITANLTRQLLARSEGVCIVENEIGQIGVDDLLVINKIDLNGDIGAIKSDIRQMGVSCPLVPLSAAADSGAGLLAEVEKVLG